MPLLAGLFPATQKTSAAGEAGKCFFNDPRCVCGNEEMAQKSPTVMLPVVLAASGRSLKEAAWCACNVLRLAIRAQ